MITVQRKAKAVRPPATAPFTIAVDTREQIPYRFASIQADRRLDPLRRYIVIPTVRKTLQQGDYSVVGLETVVAIERKSLCDLFNTLGQGRRRFEAELNRLQSSVAFAAVIVEADWREILGDPPSRSRLTPKTVFRSVVAWQQRYPRIHWWTVTDREMGEVTCYRVLERAWIENERK